MLSQDRINKISRIMDQVGELRPGFLHDGASPLEGSVEACYSATGNQSRSRTTSKKVISVNVQFEKDEATGEVRTVVK